MVGSDRVIGIYAHHFLPALHRSPAVRVLAIRHRKRGKTVRVLRIQRASALQRAHRSRGFSHLQLKFTQSDPRVYILRPIPHRLLVFARRFSRLIHFQVIFRQMPMRHVQHTGDGLVRTPLSSPRVRQLRPIPIGFVDVPQAIVSQRQIMHHIGVFRIQVRHPLPPPNRLPQISLLGVPIAHQKAAVHHVIPRHRILRSELQNFLPICDGFVERLPLHLLCR